ncbi:hypothetical protein [Streptomyces sp. NPDC057253]|uniref:hypothetical protein n=1 Tax=Streptomyces sp. NPDC057253 TaxID=3346069 RepID=UPI00362AC38D
MPDLPERESGRKPSRQEPRRSRDARETRDPGRPAGPVDPGAPRDTPDSLAGRGPRDPHAPRETDAERRRRRAQFLRDLAEARELRDRVQPRRAKVARLRHAMRMRTFRW